MDTVNSEVAKEHALRDIVELRLKEIEYDTKLASIKGMFNVFIIATVGFLGSAGAVWRFDVKDGIEIWWFGASVGCVLAIGGLFIYIVVNWLLLRSTRTKLRPMEQRFGVAPAPQPNLTINLPHGTPLPSQDQPSLTGAPTPPPGPDPNAVVTRR